MPRTPIKARLAARVAASRRPPDAEPWMPAVAGSHYYLLISEIEAAALAEGLILNRTQAQARYLVRWIDGGQEAAR
jgi:hypothetical protein